MNDDFKFEDPPRILDPLTGKPIEMDQWLKRNEKYSVLTDDECQVIIGDKSVSKILRGFHGEIGGLAKFRRPKQGDILTFQDKRYGVRERFSVLHSDPTVKKVKDPRDEFRRIFLYPVWLERCRII